MDLTPYVDKLRRELAVAASAGGEEAQALAERLVSPLESATRLALLEALSAAAEEITRDLAPGSVDVRLRGRDPDFVVTPPPTHEERPDRAAAPAPVEADDGGTARITLRVPDQLKPRIEEAAARAGVSVNSWLVRAVSGALAEPAPGAGARRREGMTGGHHYTGWVR